MTPDDAQRQESSTFVRSALFLKKAEIKLGIPLLNTDSGPLKIDVDSARRRKRVPHARAADEFDQPQQPVRGRPSEPRARAKIGPHSRRCNVCRHPHREDIEQEFLRWRSPDRIAQHYKISDHSSIYRHVHATGIFARRRKAVRAALEPIIECAEFVKVTASSLVKAVYAYAHINESGEWVNHPTQHTVIVQHTNVPENSNPPAASDPPSPVADQPVAPTTSNESLSSRPSHPDTTDGPALDVSLNSISRNSTQLNRQMQRLEHPPTPRKQRKAIGLNRQKIQKWFSSYFAPFPVTAQKQTRFMFRGH